MGDFIGDLAQGIARFEGFQVSGSRAQRNNNPGNLRAGPGQVGTDAGGYAIFPDLETGWAALDNQIQLNLTRYPTLTLREFFGGGAGYPGYAPAADQNNPGQYADTVAGWLGISPDVALSSLSATAGGPVTPSGSPDFSLDLSSLTNPEQGSSTLLWIGAAALALLAIWLATR